MSRNLQRQVYFICINVHHQSFGGVDVVTCLLGKYVKRFLYVVVVDCSKSIWLPLLGLGVRLDQEHCLYRVILVYYNLGLFFKALAIILIDNNNTVLSTHKVN